MIVIPPIDVNSSAIKITFDCFHCAFTSLSLSDYEFKKRLIATLGCSISKCAYGKTSFAINKPYNPPRIESFLLIVPTGIIVTMCNLYHSRSRIQEFPAYSQVFIPFQTERRFFASLWQRTHYGSTIEQL